MKIYLTILLIALWSISYSQIDWSVKEEFKGLVKSVTSSAYSNSSPVRFGTLTDTVEDYNSIKTRVILFDEEKRPIKSIMIGTGYCIWAYDNVGREIKQTDYRNNNRLERTIEYSYEKNGVTIRKLYDDKGKLYSTWVKEIDSANFILRNYELIKGKIDDNDLCTLNNSFLPLSCFTIDSKGNRVKYQEFSYDDKNRIVSSIFYSVDSSVYNHYENRYNKKGNIIEIKHFNKEGEIIGLTTQQFDEFGNVIQILQYSPTDINDFTTHIERIDYTYDEHGNWTSKKTYSEYKSRKDYETSKIIRIIEYY